MPATFVPDVETCTGEAPKTWPIPWRFILSATALGAGFASKCSRVTPPALGRFNQRELYVFHRSPLKPRPARSVECKRKDLPPGGCVDRCQQAVQAGKQ
jgi:hypothetical protein